MCGIAGFYGTGNSADLSAMLRAIHHRGPDSQCAYKAPDSPLYLGHTRLEILDKAGGGQPMAFGPYVIVFNGEIYNHRALRRELEQLGHSFESSHSDTESLLHAWAEWGPACLPKLNGMFAFCIWDARAQTLILARDRFGEKPLYYSFTPQCVAFASELKALKAHAGTTWCLDQTQLQRFFAFNFIPAPHTLYADVYKLEPGQYLEFAAKSSSHTIKKYYEPTLDASATAPNEEALVDELDFLLETAVKERLDSDVPLGAFLSGGIDSSLICAMIAKNNKEARAFTVAVKPASYDESPHAKTVAEYLKMGLTIDTLQLEGAWQQVPQILSKLDEPFGDYSFIPTYLVCQAIKKHATVALGGDGADELFAGYETFRGLKIAQLFGLMGKSILKPIKRLVDLIPSSAGYMSGEYKLKRMLGGVVYEQPLWNMAWLSGLTPDEIKDVFYAPLKPEDLFDDLYTFWKKHKHLSFFEMTLLYYLRYYMGDGILTKVDRASMLNSLEVRSPFLDHQLVDFALRLPRCYKFRQGHGKYLLKKVAQRYLPREIIYRKKHGFSVPLRAWLPNLSIHTVFPEVLKAEQAQKLIYAGQRGTKDHRQFLWDLFVLNQIGHGAP